MLAWNRQEETDVLHFPKRTHSDEAAKLTRVAHCWSEYRGNSVDECNQLPQVLTNRRKKGSGWSSQSAKTRQPLTQSLNYQLPFLNRVRRGLARSLTRHREFGALDQGSSNNRTSQPYCCKAVWLLNSNRGPPEFTTTSTGLTARVRWVMAI